MFYIFYIISIKYNTNIQTENYKTRMFLIKKIDIKVGEVIKFMKSALSIKSSTVLWCLTKAFSPLQRQNWIHHILNKIS